MKKIIPLIVLSLVFVTACSPEKEPESTATLPPTVFTPGQLSPGATPETKTMAADYYAFKKDTCMTYKGTGNEFAPYKSYVDYIKDGVVQTRQENAGTTAVFVYRLVDGAIKKVFFRGEIYYRYDFTSLSNTDEILIKEPIQSGTSWTLKDGSVRSITAVDKQISTASGAYKTLEITTKGKDSTQKDYYAKGIGLVKTEFTTNEDPSSAITSELEMTQIGVPYKTMARFYFPDFDNDRVVYEEREIETYTNEDVKSQLEEGLKTIPPGSGLTQTISDNTKILGISLDEDKGSVTADFSSDLIKDMNAGSALEGLLVKSIANTIGHYFQMTKVVITVEGKLYESGHIALKEGEYFTVSDDNTAEYQNP